MVSQAYLQLAGAIALNAASYTIYKAIVGASPGVWWPLFALGLGLGALNTYLFTHAIRDIPLSIAFPAFSGASFATIAIVSVAVFGEPFRVLTLAGMALVILGCAVVLYSQ